MLDRFEVVSYGCSGVGDYRISAIHAYVETS